MVEGCGFSHLGISEVWQLEQICLLIPLINFLHLFCFFPYHCNFIAVEMSKFRNYIKWMDWTNLIYCSIHWFICKQQIRCLTMFSHSTISVVLLVLCLFHHSLWFWIFWLNFFDVLKVVLLALLHRVHPLKAILLPFPLL